MGSVSTQEALTISLAGQCDRGKIFEDERGKSRHTSTALSDRLVVADHGGSDAGGKEASQIAVDTISSCIEAMPTPLFFPPELAIAEAIARANAAIVASAAQPDHPDTRLATRVVVALLRRDAEHDQAHVQAIIGRMGDGRAYLVHNQKLTLLTPDDSTRHDLLDPNRITPQEEAVADASMLANCLGKQVNGGVETRDVQLEVGTLLLCSDGLRGCNSSRRLSANCP
jgi:protein phosphatase